MTKQMMTLAEGRLALVMEGGYELKAIPDSAEMCLRALLGENIPALSAAECSRGPCVPAVDTFLTTFKIQGNVSASTVSQLLASDYREVLALSEEAHEFVHALPGRGDKTRN
jgi:hypothetical protein